MNRRQMGRAVFGLAAVVALTGVEGGARGDEAGNAVVATMDTAMNKAKTLIVDYEVINQEPGKAERKMAIKHWVKGGKQLMEFQAPADLKGTKVLILSPAEIYVYLPAFGKVRRVAAHTKDQGFLGLTFTQDDWARRAFGPSYTGALGTEAAAQKNLVLTPKPAAVVDYAKIALAVNKDNVLPAELKYFDAAGKNVKTETRWGYSCENDVCTPGEVKMVNNTSGAWTKMVAKSRKVNPDVPDDTFSKQKLGE